MLAKKLQAKYGKELIGRWVVTPAMGEYPGGAAQVSDVGHDENAPEISFLVRHPTWKNDDGDNEMGIFDYEDCQLLKRKPAP